ncbi:MAG: hypothetical protein AMJ56_18825 [Anaerolineae bacterium SG8_19]|nr:MAG: hypothetical protein AMJ56_18825 [Anaerolineae bacterium SG8_19]
MQTNGRSTRQTGKMTSRDILRSLLIAVLFFAIGTFILTYQIFPDSTIDNLDIGSVVSEGIFAPSQIVYVSDIQTEAERERASNSVSTIYTPPDPKVARQQITRLRQIFDYLDTIRADPYGSLAEKSEWVAAIPDLTLSDSVVDQILIMNDQAWTETKQEALKILEETMKAEIRETQVLLKRRELPTNVALDTPDEQANVIVAITEDLIKPNSFPDEERTVAERQAAAEGVNPTIITFEKNELIIPAGQMVGPREMEAIQALGLLKPEFSWAQDFVAPAVLMLLITVISGFYLTEHAIQILIDHKRLPLLAILVLFFVTIAKFMIPELTNLAYLYPMAALAMMIVILIDMQLAFILTTMLAFLAGYMASNNPEIIVIYLTLSGWVGVLALGKGRRVNNLLWAGVYVGLVNVGVILVFNLGAITDITDLGILMLIGLLNGIFSAGLALIGLFAIGNLAGITTSIQLTDLSRPTHPLLRQLLLKASGTYHHSLMVSNLGEQAADRIGADSLLVRVMAYYHDVGKMQRPYFFIENQPEGINVHEKLDPQISAQIIISHVKDGLNLAKKYRLPKIIREGIAQHHGTSLVKYFYYQALERASQSDRHVDEADFHYPGPRPQTKENGILMLADVCESTVRALKPGSAEEIDEIVQKVIADKLSSGELNECDLTIAELYKIRTAFVDILQGVHHPRIKYPEQIQADTKTTRAEENSEVDRSSAAAENRAGKEVPVQTPTPLGPLTDPSTRPARLVRRE